MLIENPRVLDFSDERWNGLKGGYRGLFDARPLLIRLGSGHDVNETWSELWNELHHQSDVDTASYAAVPHLVAVHRQRDVPDYNTFALMCCIEIERHHDDNPPIPDFLLPAYEQAWRDVVPLALRDLARSDDEAVVETALAVIALARGLRKIGQALSEFDDAEFGEMMSAYRDSW